MTIDYASLKLNLVWKPLSDFVHNDLRLQRDPNSPDFLTAGGVVVSAQQVRDLRAIATSIMDAHLLAHSQFPGADTEKEARIKALGDALVAIDANLGPTSSELFARRFAGQLTGDIDQTLRTGQLSRVAMIRTT